MTERDPLESAPPISSPCLGGHGTTNTAPHLDKLDWAGIEEPTWLPGPALPRPEDVDPLWRSGFMALPELPWSLIFGIVMVADFPVYLARWFEEYPEPLPEGVDEALRRHLELHDGRFVEGWGGRRWIDSTTPCEYLDGDFGNYYVFMPPWPGPTGMMRPWVPFVRPTCIAGELYKLTPWNGDATRLPDLALEALRKHLARHDGRFVKKEGSRSVGEAWEELAD